MVQQIQSIKPEDIDLGVQPVHSLDNFGEQMGWEFKYAAENPIAYPFLRTLADIVPFASFLFPSGREAFKKESALGKAVHLGLDMLPFLPAKWISGAGKIALKPITQPLKFLGSKIPKGALRPFWLEDRSVINNLISKVDKFVYVEPRTKLMVKYGITEEEAVNLMQGKHWTRSRGGWLDQREYLTNLYTKDGLMKDSVFESVVKAQAPRSWQKLQHYKDQYRRYVGAMPTIGKKGLSLDDIFNSQTRRLFGDAAEGMTLGSVGPKEFSKVLMDMLYHEGRVLRGLDVTSRHYLMPVRKVFAQFPGTIKKIYEPIKSMFGAANERALLDIDMWKQMLAAKGLAKWAKHADRSGGKFTELFTRAEFEQAGRIIRQMDDLTQAGKLGQAEKLFTATTDVNTRKIIETYREWTDFMYSEYLLHEVPRIFHKLPLTAAGARELESNFREGGMIGKALRDVFRGGNGLTHEQKFETLTNALDALKARPATHKHWFKDPQKAFESLSQSLSFRTPGAKKGIPSYLRNYAPRIFEHPLPPTRRFPTPEPTGVPKSMTAGFLKTRVAETAEGATDNLAFMIERRARSQSRQLFVYPELPTVLRFADKLPPRLKKFTEHYLNRLLGLPSETDRRVAAALSRVFGGMWDERRVMNLAWTINDLIYLGGIGFKPFSAMRNYFQPFLLVPADMGGVKDFYWLARGYRRAILDPKASKYVRDIGAITEYAPDLLFRPQVSKFATGIGARAQRIRDFGMWLFKMSDRHNRYVTGAAALEKWEHYAKKFSKNNILQGRGLADFKKKINLGSREKYVQEEIEQLLTTDALEEAKKIWVKDVIADTQYLYGPLDAPVVSQVGGSITRTAVVFQSWWMNYGAALGKWMFRSGDVPLATRRMFGWMLSGAIGYHIMSAFWGRWTAGRAVLAGPLPLSLDLPASWRPFQEALKLAVEAGSLPFGITDPSKVKSRMKSVLNTSLIFVPGGLQFKQFAKGFAEEGPEGLLKATFRFQPPKEKTPLHKLLDEIS